MALPYSVPDTNLFSLQDVFTVCEYYAAGFSGYPVAGDLADCFVADGELPIGSLFDATYEGSKDRLTNFRNYGAMMPAPTNQIYDNGSNAIDISNSSSITSSLTTPASTSGVVLGISALIDVSRSGGAPTLGGSSFTLVTSTSNTEIWYLSNPPTGTNTLTIPNTGTTYVDASVMWMGCAVEIVVNTYGGSTGTSATTSATMTLPAASYIYIFDRTTVRGASTFFSWTTQSDLSIDLSTYSLAGPTYCGSASQYRSISPYAGGSRTMTNNITISREWGKSCVCFTPITS